MVIGTAVNVMLARVLVFGRAGIPELEIDGARWATVAESWASALLALVLLRKRYRNEFATVSRWKPKQERFVRLLRDSGPAGAQVFLDVLVFHLFVQRIGPLSPMLLVGLAVAVDLWRRQEETQD